MGPNRKLLECPVCIRLYSVCMGPFHVSVNVCTMSPFGVGTASGWVFAYCGCWLAWEVGYRGLQERQSHVRQRLETCDAIQ